MWIVEGVMVVLGCFKGCKTGFLFGLQEIFDIGGEVDYR